MLAMAIDSVVPLAAMLILGYISYEVYKYILSL